MGFFKASRFSCTKHSSVKAQGAGSTEKMRERKNCMEEKKKMVKEKTKTNDVTQKGKFVREDIRTTRRKAN